MFTKILIANRGEIACRIIKTAKRLGITTVTVYADPDQGARHVKLSDEAYSLNGMNSQDTYLNIEKIIHIAKKARVEAIHPGYGFLSENTTFCQACLDNNIVFIGPPAATIELMGDKRAAKEQMQLASVPTTPGYNEKNQDDAVLLQAAKKIGFPVLIKAAAGGGGKGMRLVTTEHDFIPALSSARREAQASFVNDQLILEKYLTTARHVEMQIFCDQFGNVVHLFNRDCSIQRRHQKIIEEATAPNLPTALADAMAKAAVTAATAINYIGAGTIEFLVAENNFYFMEMNTRLQVEHPITEMITGVDLVEWQLRIAAGEKLPLSQDAITTNGHAIEARIYAEDPMHEFRPDIGKLTSLVFPHNQDDIRVDTGVSENYTISVYFDPMIAKIIAWGENRSAAIAALKQALADTLIMGVSTNLEFLHRICTVDAFQRAQLDTNFIDNYANNLFSKNVISPTVLQVAAIIADHCQRQAGKILAAKSADKTSPWFIHDGWHGINAATTISLWDDDQHYEIQQASPAEHFTFSNHCVVMTLDNEKLTVLYAYQAHKLTLVINGSRFCFYTFPPHAGRLSAETNDSKLIAPMPGTVVTVLVKSGQAVKQGERLLVLEAMKMEHTLHAPKDGKVGTIHFQPGDLVAEGIELLEFEG